MDVGDLEERLAAHVTSCRWEDLPAETIEVARLSIMDATAAMMAGRQSASARAILDMAEVRGASGEVPIYGAGRCANATTAAWCNGVMMRALELDDCTDVLPVHPTAAILPALLAAASIEPVTGRDLLRGLAIGQDLKIRFGLCLSDDALRLGRNNAFKVFATVAGLAAMLNLDSKTALAAFGIASAYGSGDARQSLIDGSMAPHIQFGHLAQAAMSSVSLAKAGISGSPAFLTGILGVLTTYEATFDIERFCKDLGRSFENSRIALKPYASCRLTHAAIDMARQARRDIGGDPAAVDRIELKVAPEVKAMVGQPHEALVHPKTATAAQFSLQFTFATALRRDGVGLFDTMPEALADAATISLADRVTVEGVPSLRTRTVLGQATATVVLHDGRRLEYRADVPSGGYGNPMSAGQRKAKFLDCARFADRPVQEEDYRSFHHRIASLEKEPDAAAAFAAFI